MHEKQQPWGLVNVIHEALVYVSFISAKFTLVICPGIANSSETSYIRTFVTYAQTHGFRVAVLNHLGALSSEKLTAPRIFTYGNTVKPVLRGHSKIDKTKVLDTDYCLMMVKSIAECSSLEHSAILLTCIKPLSNNGF